MIIFTPYITPRLQYAFDFVFKAVTTEAFSFTSDAQEYRNYQGVHINYSGDAIQAGEFFLRPRPLLFETAISLQDTTCFDWKGNKAFFRTEGDLPFDIFAATFYLLSRYEEYLPHAKDGYGRYAHTNALAFHEKFLDKPLINYWLLHFRELISERFPTLPIASSSFQFIPTYDIDMAWSFLHKGWLRQAGGFFRYLLKSDWKAVKERWAVIRGRQTDPFDAYVWLHQLHQRYHLKPYYFFLLAARNGVYDKNISPRHRAMRKLVHDHFIRYPVGIHPSWQSGDAETLLKQEIAELGAITGQPVFSSRQHYIRLTLPQTYRQLLAHGIQYDFSMGYGSINGFRASVAAPFYWYDLHAEQTTNLMLFPFCYMDANSFYEQHHTPEQALKEMQHYNTVVREVKGQLIMIWHNSFLGTDPLYKGWKNVYEEFIQAYSK